MQAGNTFCYNVILIAFSVKGADIKRSLKGPVRIGQYLKQKRPPYWRPIHPWLYFLPILFEKGVRIYHIFLKN